MTGRRRIGAAAVVAALAACAPASAAELVVVDLPSAGNVDVAKVRFNGAKHPRQLRANVLLPDGFDPSRRYPVLYLLHGAGEAYTSWFEKTKAGEAAKGLDAIVVMPEAASGFYLDWYVPGGPRWERYFLDEVIPAIEARFPIRPGRRWHAVAGFSMGGYGAAYLASQRPDYFGAASPMSGFVAPRRPEMPLVFGPATGQRYETLFGPADGPYARGHDPIALAPNLRHTRMFVITGNGVPDPAVPPPSSPTAVVTDSAGEAELAMHSRDLAAATRAAGADTTLVVMDGTHTHAYWNRHLRRLLAWDPFAPVAEDPERWSYTTVAEGGRAWDLTYRFGGRPAAVQTLSRDGSAYSGTGAGRVELCAPDGRGLSAELPFSGRTLTRPVELAVPDGRRSTALRRGGVRVAVRARGEAASVRLDARVVEAGRTARLRAAAVELGDGERRVLTLRLGAGARRLLDRVRTARVRVVARHGTCTGGRWATAARRLR